MLWNALGGHENTMPTLHGFEQQPQIPCPPVFYARDAPGGHENAMPTLHGCDLIRILFLCNPFRVLQLLCGPVLSRVARVLKCPGLPYAALSGQETQDPPQGEFTADRCCPFSSAGTGLPDEPEISTASRSAVKYCLIAV
jgi:hypothetical protein